MALDGRCFERPWSQASWETELGRDWVRVWMLKGEGPRLIGYAVCWHLDKEAELLRIAVCSNERHRGHGKVLLRHARLSAKKEGCSRMSLEVQADNEPAIALYRALGFEAVGRRLGYYAGKDALLFACALNEAQRTSESSE